MTDPERDLRNVGVITLVADLLSMPLVAMNVLAFRNAMRGIFENAQMALPAPTTLFLSMPAAALVGVMVVIAGALVAKEFAMANKPLCVLINFVALWLLAAFFVLFSISMLMPLMSMARGVGP